MSVCRRLRMIKQFYKQTLIVLFAILALLIVIFFSARRSIDAYTINVSRTALEQVQSIVDTKIEETANTAYQLHSSPDLQSVSRSEDIFGRGTIIRTLNYQRNLLDYNMYNRYLLFNFTLFVHNNYVIMPHAGQDLVSFSRNFSNEYFPTGFTAQGFLDYLQGVNTNFGGELTYSGGGTRVQVIPYVRWMRSFRGTETATDCAVVVLLNASMISELLSQSLSTEKSAFCIIDKNNSLLASSRPLSQTEQDYLNGLEAHSTGSERVGDNYTALRVAARNPAWRYVLFADNREASRALNSMLLLIIIVGAACFVFAIATAASIIAKNNQMLKPIFQMVDLKDFAFNKQDAYRFLSQRIQKIQEDKSYLDRQMKKQEAVIQEVYLNNLLKGDKSDYDDQLRMLEELGFDLKDNWYFTAIASIRFVGDATYSHQEMQRLKNLLFESVKPFSQTTLCCNLSQYEFALIISSKQAQAAGYNREYVDMLYKLLSSLMEKDAVYLTLSVGGIHTGDNAIPVSFAEAKLNNNLSLVNDRCSVVWHNSQDNHSASYYYPPEAEVQMINAIRSGNRPLVEKLIKELFDINFIEKRMSYEFLSLFLYDFYGSILKVVNSGDSGTELQEEIFKFYAKNAHEIASIEFQQKFLQYIFALTDSFNRNKKSHNDLLIEKITQYIRQNYDKYDLTMYRVADEFKLSSGYLSAFFKEQTGTTFSDYIVNTKMEKAAELVRSTNLAINEIAVKTGYCSANTFGRAFRKFFGISPMEMRASQCS